MYDDGSTSSASASGSASSVPSCVLAKHVAYVCYPAVGHVIPAMQLARALVENHGCVVSFFTYTNICLRFRLETHIRIRVHEIEAPEGMNHWLDLGIFLSLHENEIVNSITHTLSPETPLIRGCKFHEDDGAADQLPEAPTPRPGEVWPPVQLLLHDHWLPWCFKIARSLHIPHVAFCCSPSQFFYFCINYYELFERFRDNRNALCDIPGIGVVPIAQGGIFSELPKSEVESKAHAVTQASVNGMLASDGYIFNDLEAFVPQELLKALSAKKLVRCIGPLTKFDKRFSKCETAAALPPSSELDIWLSSHSPGSVVYIAAGSWFNIPPTDLVELAYGLKRCGHPFLWSFRPQTGNSNKLVFIQQCELPNSGSTTHFDEATCYQPWAHKQLDRTTEAVDLDGLPQGFREWAQTSNMGRIFPWTDQTAVLRHPAIGCFVTHCGWNSVIECLSMSNGIPIYCVPLGCDQFCVSHYVTKILKAGIEAWNPVVGKVRSLKRIKISADLKCLLSLKGNEYRQRALDILQYCKTAHEPQTGIVWKAIEDLLNVF